MVNELLRKMPFVRIVLPVLIGIDLQVSLRLSSLAVRMVTLLLIFLMIGIYLKINSRFYYYRDRLFGCIITFFLFLLGASLPDHHIPCFYPESLIIVTVMNGPAEKAKTCKIMVSDIYKRDSLGWKKMSGKGILYLEKEKRSESLLPGERILAYTKMPLVRGPQNPYEFDYRAFLYNRDIYWEAFIKKEKWEKLTSERSFSLSLYAENYRLQKLRTIGQISEDPEVTGLLESLLLGYRENLEPDQQQHFSTAGAMHILAVSGLHVGIIYMIIQLFLGRLKRYRSFKGCSFLVSVSILWGYAFITGLSVSVLRATLMFTIFSFSKLVNRHTNPVNIIALSALILVLIRPRMIQEVGFQLSFLAITGITIFYPSLHSAITVRNRLLRSIWSLFCISLSAQVMTFPLTIFYFHQFSVYFIVTNLMVIPLASIILCVGFFFLILHKIVILQMCLSKILNFLAVFLNTGVEQISKMPMSHIDCIFFEKHQVILVYLIIVLLAMFLYSKAARIFIYYLIILIVYLCVTCISVIIRMDYSQFIIYNIPGYTAINFLEPRSNVLMLYPQRNVNEQVRYHIRNYWYQLHAVRPVFLNNNHQYPYLIDNLMVMKTNKIGNHYLAQFNDTRIGIIRKWKFNITSCTQRLQLDYLILTDQANCSLYHILKFFDPGMVIIDTSCPKWETDRWIRECEQANISFYVVNRQGYFELVIDMSKI